MRASRENNKARDISERRALRVLEEDSSRIFTDIFANQMSRQAQRMRAEVTRVARRPYNILITGETGTGKTQMARQIHRISARADNPLIELNCANLPEHLVEAELFGHRKGAFTGADHDRKGLFEEANGGILFLDEIGDIPLTIQNRLLKAIEEKQIKRLGTNHYQFCDVQIIAATSRNLPTMIQNSEFREDLYFRLAVLTIETCPLRERREDIPAIVAAFLSEAATSLNSPQRQRETYVIEHDALALLSELDHPGNIRALRNIVYELTSYVEDNEPISAELVQFALSRLNFRAANNFTVMTSDRRCEASPEISNSLISPNPMTINSTRAESLLRSMAGEGDIILPLELCVLRRGETFKQWTARAKHCSIEAVRQTTGGTLRTVAERLGLTPFSLKSHLQRAKRDQNEALFVWQRESE
jgi:transcriptional regulator with PAS, ATPase and Fis domain